MFIKQRFIYQIWTIHLLYMWVLLITHQRIFVMENFFIVTAIVTDALLQQRYEMIQQSSALVLVNWVAHLVNNFCPQLHESLGPLCGDFVLHCPRTTIHCDLKGFNHFWYAHWCLQSFFCSSTVPLSLSSVQILGNVPASKGCASAQLMSWRTF